MFSFRCVNISRMIGYWALWVLQSFLSGMWCIEGFLLQQGALCRETPLIPTTPTQVPSHLALPQHTSCFQFSGLVNFQHGAVWRPGPSTPVTSPEHVKHLSPKTLPSRACQLQLLPYVIHRCAAIVTFDCVLGSVVNDTHKTIQQALVWVHISLNMSICSSVA